MSWYQQYQKNQTIGDIEQIISLLHSNNNIIPQDEFRELMSVLTEQTSNKFFILKRNKWTSSYYNKENDLIKFINLVLNHFPNLNAFKISQTSANGDVSEKYCITNKNAQNDLFNALKLNAQEGYTDEYHTMMGNVYNYTPEEIQEFIEKQKNIEKKDFQPTQKPSIIVKDIRNNTSQELL